MKNATALVRTFLVVNKKQYNTESDILKMDACMIITVLLTFFFLIFYPVEKSKE